jgi:serine/tyrosine/threonine adenylyltransferase
VSVAAPTLFDLRGEFAAALPELSAPWQPTPAPGPRIVVLNTALARELALDPDALRSTTAAEVLAGSALIDGTTPVAQAYAGHQFGSYSPRLGDGRAVLLGELIDRRGRRRDLHLKGSGRTRFARGGDGRAALGPMLREHLLGEAMHALGIPTTRSLAVVETGEQVVRATLLPGAVLARVAGSHLRVGTFQYAAATGDLDLLRRLVAHAIDRHHAEAARPALALLEGVVEAQASLVARWVLVGFIHGVMNTDNTAISGETIDYGPCAFMDAYDPATVYSSIDHAGRYAYGQQPTIAQWNLARLAEALLPLIDDDVDAAVEAATEAVRAFAGRYRHHWRRGMRAKLGLVSDGGEGDDALVEGLLTLLYEQEVDLTSAFRSLSAVALGDRSLFSDPAPFEVWAQRWADRRASEGTEPAVAARSMDEVNPVYIPRNHLVEEGLDAAHDGDLAPFEQLLEVLADPYRERPGLERYAAAAPLDLGPYQTFCGT